MANEIRTWAELAKVTGRKSTALVMAWRRGRLPFSPEWQGGVRVFNRAEVEAWLRQQASR